MLILFRQRNWGGMLVVFHGCVLLVSVICKLWGGPLAGHATRQIENTRAIFRYSRFVQFLFGGCTGSHCGLTKAATNIFFSREAVRNEQQCSYTRSDAGCRAEMDRTGSWGLRPTLARFVTARLKSFGYLWSSY